MNIIFMGTPSFAVPSLEALAAARGYNIGAIFTRPDAVSRRGSALVPSPVRLAAEQLGFGHLVHTPRDFYLRDEQGKRLLNEQACPELAPSIFSTIKHIDPELIVVAAYGVILPRDILELPAHGCINVHASLLPRWRGAAPIQRALLAGDEELGVSIMRMEEGLDTGPYCAVASTSAQTKNASELTDELAQLGAKLLIETLPAIINKTAVWVTQDDSKVSYAHKIEKNELFLDEHSTADENLKRVRASTPQAPARCIIKGRSATVLSAQLPQTVGSQEPNERHAKARLFFSCSDGDLEILSLRPDGKRSMTAAAFIAGLT